MPNKHSRKNAVVIGNSFNNTLGLIRSLGKAGVRVNLILVGKDRLYIAKSRYISKLHTVNDTQECLEILLNSPEYFGSYLICSFDEAANWIDSHEEILANHYRTPMMGKQLGPLFDKPFQCQMAAKFNIKVPKSSLYIRGAEFPKDIPFPIILKPANSTTGAKSDIHVCHNERDLAKSLEIDSDCSDFIVQEYIDKDYEINLIGVSTKDEIIIPGGIKKIRHFPNRNSPCSFGIFLSKETLGIDTTHLIKMISSIGYTGPFSVEFVRKDGVDYFMEINFRHDGLAYAATAAGINLLGRLFSNEAGNYKVTPTYMMDLSIDYNHVKEGNIDKRHWLRDFIKTRCQLNFNISDPAPTFHYYFHKLLG